MREIERAKERARERGGKRERERESERESERQSARERERGGGGERETETERRETGDVPGTHRRSPVYSSLCSPQFRSLRLHSCIACTTPSYTPTSRPCLLPTAASPTLTPAWHAGLPAPRALPYPARPERTRQMPLPPALVATSSATNPRRLSTGVRDSENYTVATSPVRASRVPRTAITKQHSIAVTSSVLSEKFTSGAYIREYNDSSRSPVRLRCACIQHCAVFAH